jgi:signal peptidase II
MFPGKLSRTAVALIISGIFGNLTDRLFRRGDDGVLFGGGFLDGYVVDFLRFDFGFWPFNPWPSFNVADSCVVVAAILLGIASFVEQPPQKPVVKS